MPDRNKIIRRALIVSCLINFAVVGDSEGQQAANHPLESGRVIDEIAPQPGEIFSIGMPQSYFDFKDDVYDRIGLKIGFSVQMLGQAASDVPSTATYDTALGIWWGVNSKWTMLNKGEDYEGSLVFNAFKRGAVGDNALPAQFGASDVGAIWTNIEFTSWDFSVEDLYWEQWLKGRRFMFRVGNQISNSITNPFRFKDSRKSFTTSPYAFHESVPTPTFGLGVAFKWWPVEDSELYVAGTLNDMNGDPNLQGFDWSTFSRGEYFYQVEVGHYWRRDDGEFDHVHLGIFYADERSTRSPEGFNEAGGGVRVLGSKQVDNWVGFASYTFNTAQGGGAGATFAKHTGTAGIAYQTPFSIRGEAALAFMFMSPNEDIDIFSGPDVSVQYGGEAYWTVLLTRNMWFNAGLQLVVNPAFTTEIDFAAIPHAKFRFAL